RMLEYPATRQARGSKSHLERKTIQSTRKATISSSRKGKLSPSSAINHQSCGGRKALQQASRKTAARTRLAMMNIRLTIFLGAKDMLKITTVRPRKPVSG